LNASLVGAGTRLADWKLFPRAGSQREYDR
jgi:hypothetical protein